MAERINKLYKPAELEEAIGALSSCITVYGSVHEYSKATLKNLHLLGWRLVKVSDEKA